MSVLTVLFVCQDNAFTSPLAAHLAQRAVAKDRADFMNIESAGLSVHRVAIADRHAPDPRTSSFLKAGFDPTQHRATQLTKHAIETADLIIAVDFDTASAVWGLVPHAWSKVFSLREFVYYARKINKAPPVDFDPANRMASKVAMAQALRRQARSEFGFWAGLRLEDHNLPMPGKRNANARQAATDAWVKAVQALVFDVVKLLDGRVGSTPVAAGR